MYFPYSSGEAGISPVENSQAENGKKHGCIINVILFSICKDRDQRPVSERYLDLNTGPA
jgi:hypothetical protein